LACFDALFVHWKEAKGRGHPAAVAALNSVAQVYRWEMRQNDVASAFMRALRESNAHVEPAAAAAAASGDGSGGGGGAGLLSAFGTKGKAAAAEAAKQAAVAAEVGEQTAEAAAAAAAADEKEARIAHLREEKQAAVAREDYKAATRLKQEILELQLQVRKERLRGRTFGGKKT
jgi:cysteinyl-tRNA synthetase